MINALDTRTNNAYLDLFDETKFKKFIDESASQLKQMLEMLI